LIYLFVQPVTGSADPTRLTRSPDQKMQTKMRRPMTRETLKNSLAFKKRQKRHPIGILCSLYIVAIPVIE
jgi:hypothetical protein